MIDKNVTEQHTRDHLGKLDATPLHVHTISPVPGTPPKSPSSASDMSTTTLTLAYGSTLVQTHPYNKYPPVLLDGNIQPADLHIWERSANHYFSQMKIRGMMSSNQRFVDYANRVVYYNIILKGIEHHSDDKKLRETFIRNMSEGLINKSLSVNEHTRIREAPNLNIWIKEIETIDRRWKMELKKHRVKDERDIKTPWTRETSTQYPRPVRP